MLGLADFGFSPAISRQAAYSLGLDATKGPARTSDFVETSAGWLGVSELYASSRVIFWRVTAIAGVVMILLYELVLPHTKLLETRTLQTELVWYALGLSILLNLQTRLSQSFLDGIGFMFLGRLISGSYALLWNIASAIALLFARGLLSMSIAVLVASVIQYVTMHISLSKFAGREIDFTLRASKPLARHLWRVALPFGFVNSGVYLVGAVQIPLLGSILGPAAVSPYYLAARIVQTFGAAIQQITLTQSPFFTQQLAAKNIAPAKHRMNRTIGLGSLLHIVAALFLYFGSPPLVRLWVGSGQYVGNDVLFVVTLNFLIGGLAVVPGHFVLAAGSNPFALTTLIQGALTIAGVVVLCPKIGILGVPLSSLLAGLCTNYWYNPFKAWQTWNRLSHSPTKSTIATAEECNEANYTRSA